MLRVLKHICIVAAGVFAIVILPLLCTGNASALFSDGLDGVSSASVVLDAPSGEYIVLINKELHTDEENLETWIDFFNGEDILYIFEDVSCSVANTDSGGIDMADSYRSRLPENQMVLKGEDPTLLLSRADAGLFDIIVMSKEFADAYSAQTAYTENVVVIEVTSEQ